MFKQLIKRAFDALENHVHLLKRTAQRRREANHGIGKAAHDHLVGIGKLPGIRAIRNAGLFFGVDIGLDGSSASERRAMALDVVNAMRDDGVLISTTGANEDSLKIRPPLICGNEHVDLFLAAIKTALGKVAGK